MTDEIPAQHGPSLGETLGRLRAELVSSTAPVSSVNADFCFPRSAENLAHYVALRSRDLRPLQARLVASGLSSLGRSEQWVLGSVEAALRAATALEGVPVEHDSSSGGTKPLTMAEGRALLESRADDLLGPHPSHRRARIMVTMPDDAAEDPSFIPGCIARGMNIMRINTAKGEASEWLSMIGLLRQSGEPEARRCRVFADLPGPKLRINGIRKRGRAREGAKVQVGDRVFISDRALSDRGWSEPVITVGPAGILNAVREADVVWFDDGKIGLVASEVGEEGLWATVTFTKPGGQRIRLGKGMNLPDTPLDLPAMTDEDRSIVEALWTSVDAFELSFVRSPEDVVVARNLWAELSATHCTPAPALVLKIETRPGFERLPELLFELLRCPRGGVMLARGDLAVECGFERLADIQEELLCFCEAAHVPVIWATEVLSTLAKHGRPTRAEITDAAMAQRAECVMLNKGPNILHAVEVLGDILARMERHQVKKTAMFRPLGIASRVSPVRDHAFHSAP